MEKEVIDALNSIIIELRGINNNSLDLSAMLSALLGAVVGGLITWLIMRSLEKYKIKKDIEIRTAYEIISIINDFQTSLVDFITYLMKDRKTIYDMCEFKALINPDPSYTQESLRLWINVLKPTAKLFIYFDSRYIILHKFVKIKEFLWDEKEKLSTSVDKLQDKLIELDHSRQTQNKLSIEKIEELVLQHKECSNIAGDILGYLHDFIVDIQNHMLDDLFENIVVPKRKPLDQRVKVISINDDEFNNQ